jgi:predicted Zn-dependent protease
MRIAGSSTFSLRSRWSSPPSRSESKTSNTVARSDDTVTLSTARNAKPTLVKQTGMGLMAALSLAGALMGTVGCTPQPPSEGPETSFSAELTYYYMSAEQEVELGKAVTARLEAQTPLWNNPQAQKRVDRLAERLVPHSMRDDIEYSFKLLDTDMVNAMAAPGGTIYITRGLYDRFEKDEYLLFIMGHEMGHVEQRHSIAQMGKGALLDLGIRLTTDRGDNAETVGRIAEKFVNNKVSQSDEHESDRTGQAHLIQMGINPWHAVDAMKLLAQGTEGMEPEIITEIFGSHPPSAERVEELAKGAEGYERP